MEATTFENFFARSISFPTTKFNCARERGTNISAINFSWFEGPLEAFRNARLFDRPAFSTAKAIAY